MLLLFLSSCILLSSFHCTAGAKSCRGQHVIFVKTARWSDVLDRVSGWVSNEAMEGIVACLQEHTYRMQNHLVVENGWLLAHAARHEATCDSKKSPLSGPMITLHCNKAALCPVFCLLCSLVKAQHNCELQ